MTNKESPDARLSELELPGSAGTPRNTGRQYHQHSTAFENQEFESSPAHCEVCGSSIPPNRARCTDHQVSDAGTESSSDYNWSLSRVAIAIVPASNVFHAVAMGSSAFRLRQGSQGSRDSYDLIYDFDEPSKTLTSGWGGGLPDAVPLKSEAGQRLFECAKEKTNWETALDVEKALGVTNSPLSDAEAYIFSETGDEIVDTDQLGLFENSLPEDDQEFWVVPAALYTPKRDTSGKTVRNHDCPSCGSTTQHVFEGYDGGHPSLNSEGAAVWTCLECDTSHAGGAPVGHEPAEPWNDEDFAGGDRHSVDDAIEQEHAETMARLDSKGELE